MQALSIYAAALFAFFTLFWMGMWARSITGLKRAGILTHLSHFLLVTGSGILAAACLDYWRGPGEWLLILFVIGILFLAGGKIIFFLTPYFEP